MKIQNLLLTWSLNPFDVELLFDQNLPLEFWLENNRTTIFMILVYAYQGGGHGFMPPFIDF